MMCHLNKHYFNNIRITGKLGILKTNIDIHMKIPGNSSENRLLMSTVQIFKTISILYTTSVSENIFLYRGQPIVSYQNPN